MGRLVFDDIAAVRELYDHASKCVNHRKTYGEERGAGLWLVHDQGVYLMSTGIPHLELEEGSESSKVVQARGCDPKKNEDWWETSRELVGGDDFVEHIPLDTWMGAFFFIDKKGGDKIVIDISTQSIEVGVLGHGKPPTPTAAVTSMADDIDID